MGGRRSASVRYRPIAYVLRTVHGNHGDLPDYGHRCHAVPVLGCGRSRPRDVVCAVCRAIHELATLELRNSKRGAGRPMAAISRRTFLRSSASPRPVRTSRSMGWIRRLHSFRPHRWDRQSAPVLPQPGLGVDHTATSTATTIPSPSSAHQTTRTCADSELSFGMGSLSGSNRTTTAPTTRTLRATARAWHGIRGVV